MSRQSLAERAIALLAKELVQLAAAVRAVDALERGPQRVRAALAVLRAHTALGAALGHPAATAWSERGRAPLERALAAIGGENTPDFDTRQALLDAQCDERRAELLVRGLSLRGRAAVLHRVCVELETRPAHALALAARAPAPWTAEATRLAESGVLRSGKLELFVGRADDESADHFVPSRALAAACARAGAHDAFLRVSRALGSVDAVLEVVALFAGGDRRAAFGRLARLSSRERDRARLALVPHEIERSGTQRAEALARDIGSRAKRAWAFAAIVHSDALELVVRRELLAEIQDVAPLERALLAAEIAVARQSAFALFSALERAGKLLCQHASLGSVDDRRPSGWERALRCALVLALSDQTPPQRLRFSRDTLLVLAQSPFLRRELGALLPLAPRALDALVARLPAGYTRFGAVLRGLVVEARAARVRAAERIQALRALNADSELARPTTREAAIVAGALGPPAGVGLCQSVSCPLRAAHDLGVALSPQATRRRRVLLNAAKAGLRAARGPDDAEVVRLRVATLRQLEGTGVADLAGKLLVQCELPRAARLELLELVVQHQSSRAADFVWSHFATLTRRGRDAADVLDLVERLGATEAGTAEAWAELRSACGPVRACDWWTGFFEVWRRSFRRSAGKRLLAACSAAIRAGDLPENGRLSGELIATAIARWGTRGFAGLFAHGAERDLEWLVLACEPEPDRSWPVARWQKLVARLDDEIGSVDGAVVSGLLRKLPGATPATAAALLSGAAPTTALERPVAIGHGLELTYLDKRRELLPFLRIADCVGCCFSSDGPHYDGSMRTSQWILRLYRDPLSYGFHVRRSEDGARVGFVFGGFGLLREPALLLNGVYLRRQEAVVRAAVLAAIEHNLARPLGVAHVGVASLHGGTGELPPDYALDTRRGIRLRALRDLDGSPERLVYDDISRTVNEETDLCLYFKSLAS